MTFTPTASQNLLDYPHPSESRECFFGDNSDNLRKPTKFTPSPLSYFVPNLSWGSDVFVDADAIQRQVANEPHPLGRPFPLVPNGVSSLLSSILDSTDNPGNQLIPWILGSLFQLAPTFLPPALTASDEPGNEWRTDKGKGKARAAVFDDTSKQGPEPTLSEDDSFADTLREVMAASRRADSRIRSPDEAGPSGSSTSTLTQTIAPSSSSSTSPPQIYLPSSHSEQAEIDHAILMSSIEHIENTLVIIRANFIFPSQLDCGMPSHVDSSGTVMSYLLATPANSTVLDFVRDLRGLLLRLDCIGSKGDVEAESMKAKLTGAINGVLEDVESKVEEVIWRWMSLQGTGTGVVERQAETDGLMVSG